MTDKEIIVDGVDVSECEKLGETINGIACGLGKRIRFANEIIIMHNLCKNNPNCHYKQLKHKEQECEELKKKKEENEKFYLTRYANKDSRCLELEHEQNKYKQALAEIEKIVNADYYQDSWAALAIKIDSIKGIIDKRKET